jgi:hypothetical protein
VVFSALLNSRRGQPLAVASLLDKLALQSGNLPVKEIIGLVNQAQGAFMNGF